MNKLITTTTLILLVTFMSSQATTVAASEERDRVNPVSTGVPGLNRIKADMTGHFLHMDEGLPVFTDLTS